MGISGLLPVLKSITEAKGIEEYRGKTLAIDGYCWSVVLTWLEQRW
jgi:exonuclease-1